MKPYVRSSLARVLREADGQYLIFNGVNVQLWVPQELFDLLSRFEQPQDLEEIIRRKGTSAQLLEGIAAMRRQLFLVPASPDHLEDMRATWNCLAQGTESDAAYVIDNESRTLDEFWQSGKEAVAALDALVTLDPAWSVANIGCGMGRLERFLAPRVARIIGLDVSDEMLERARRHLADCPNVELRRADQDLERLDAGSVDLVISFLVFQHCPKEITWNYFREAQRALKPGGRFVFQILCYEAAAGNEPTDASPLERYYGKGKARYGETEVRQQLDQCGFAVEMFRDGVHTGVERRLSGTSAPHWTSKLARAIKA